MIHKRHAEITRETAPEGSRPCQLHHGSRNALDALDTLEDGSMDIYRKKQQWDAASLPDPVISPQWSYRQLMDPPIDRWRMFLTFGYRTLGELVQEELADLGVRPDAINERRDEYARDSPWHSIKISVRC